MAGRVWKRGDIWHIEFSYRGKEYRKSTGIKNRKAAEKILTHYLSLCARGEFRGFEREKPLTVNELFDDLVADCTARDLREVGTIIRRIAPLRQAFGTVEATQLTERHLDLYVKKQRAAKRAAATLTAEMTYLGQAYRLAQRKKLVVHLPVLPRFKVRNARQGFFEADEIDRVVQALPEHLQDFTRFAYYSSWRRSEIASLEWRDVSETTIRLRPTNSKTGEGRVLTMTGVIAEIMARRQTLRKDLFPYVFHREGHKIKRFDAHWKTACKHAGVPGKFFHDLRRTAVRNMVRAGVAERIAMQISGHTTRSIFDRYNIVNEEDIRLAQEKLSAHLSDTRCTGKISRLS